MKRKVESKVTGTVPAPDGKGTMTRVVLTLPCGTEVVWLTRSDEAAREAQIKRVQERIEEDVWLR